MRLEINSGKKESTAGWGRGLGIGPGHSVPGFKKYMCVSVEWRTHLNWGDKLLLQGIWFLGLDSEGRVHSLADQSFLRMAPVA